MCSVLCSSVVDGKLQCAQNGDTEQYIDYTQKASAHRLQHKIGHPVFVINREFTQHHSRYIHRVLYTMDRSGMSYYC